MSDSIGGLGGLARLLALVVVSSCVAVFETTDDSPAASMAVDGGWIITECREDGNPSRTRVGDHVQIRNSGGRYTLDGVDSVVDNAMFERHGRSFSAQVMLGSDELQDMFSTLPQREVARARTDLVFRVRLELSADGNEFLCSEDNFTLRFLGDSYHHADRRPDWWIYRMRRVRSGAG